MNIYDYLIYGKDSETFDTIYTENLQHFLQKYRDANLLKHGNRYRAKLVMWGYLFGDESGFDKNYRNVFNVATAIELIHKASLIIDDIIDGDEMRYGEAAFHIQYSINEAVVCAINMLGNASKLMNDAINDLGILSGNVSYINALLSDIIISMSTGALMEMNQKKLSYDDFKYMVELQTSKIITNALIIGYLCSNRIDENVIDLLVRIGDKCGFIYQCFNDLEPIYNSQFNQEHKGKVNNDSDRNRKNILYFFENELEKNKVYTKETILDKVLSLIKTDVQEIYGLIEQLKPYCSSDEWVNNFILFFSQILLWGSNRDSLNVKL